MSSIDALSGLGRIANPFEGSSSAQPPKADFGETLGNMLDEVNGMIVEAGQGAEKMASGEVSDIHEVMVAAEKAGIGLELVVEIRNKLLDAYKEVMRTQI